MRPRRRPGEAPIPRGVRLFDPATLGRLCRARDWLAVCFDRRTPLQDVARQAALSPFYFNRLFTEAFGETPQFIQPPTERFYGVEALMKDNSGNWFSMTEPKGF